MKGFFPLELDQRNLNARGRVMGEKTRPCPSPPEWWAPRPSPRLRHPAPNFRMFLDRNVRKLGAGWWGMRGGSGGRGLGSRARGNYLLACTESRLLPQPCPPLVESRATIRPHIRGGGGHSFTRVGWGWVRGRLDPPSPRPHPNHTQRASRETRGSGGDGGVNGGH